MWMQFWIHGRSIAGCYKLNIHIERTISADRFALLQDGRRGLDRKCKLHMPDFMDLKKEIDHPKHIFSNSQSRGSRVRIPSPAPVNSGLPAFCRRAF